MKIFSILIIFLTYYINNINSYKNITEISNEDIYNLLKPGNCRKSWRSERLIGRCFGLKMIKQNIELQSIFTKYKLKINNPTDCRALCCNLKELCISWQYNSVLTNDEEKCKIGGDIRYGNEQNGIANWCDPIAPKNWNGNKLVSRTKVDDKYNECVWNDDTLSRQCFGLGNERFNESKDKNRISLNTNQCRDKCCQDNNCQIWQEMDGRGCFHSDKNDVWCDINIGIYEGGRKHSP
jgi:hypothetical protein